MFKSILNKLYIPIMLSMFVFNNLYFHLHIMASLYSLRGCALSSIAIWHWEEPSTTSPPVAAIAGTYLSSPCSLKLLLIWKTQNWCQFSACQVVSASGKRERNTAWPHMQGQHCMWKWKESSLRSHLTGRSLEQLWAVWLSACWTYPRMTMQTTLWPKNWDCNLPKYKLSTK